MAITSITIENFKCIGDAVTIPIRPITLLFGKNSSGKSTVIQALIYMSEVLKSTEFDPKLLPIGLLDPNRTGGGLDPDRTGIGGDYIDLGSFHSLVHRHELDRKIRIRIEFDSSILEKPYSLYFERESHDEIHDEITLSITDLLSIDEPSLESMWLEMVIGWDAEKDRTKQSAFSLGLNGIEWFRTIEEHPESPGTEWYRFKPNDSHYSNYKSGYFNIAHPLIDKHLGFLEFTSKNAKNSYFNINKGIVYIGELELSYIRYLGPLRKVPPRNFDPQKTPDESLWATGLEAWNILGREPMRVERINFYMKDILKLGYTINRKEYTLTEQAVDPIEQSSPQIIRLKLHDEKNDIDLDPLDVGLGISQVIPVLVGTEKESGVFAVENPELHLHPAAQVALGDVFIDGIQNSHCTMLIETHSEHLLLRLLRRVRETNVRNSKEYEWRQSSMTSLDREMSEAIIRDAENQDSKEHQLTPDDLSVVYVRPTSEGIKFTPISVTDDGDFYAPWPEGFFDERVKELF